MGKRGKRMPTFHCQPLAELARQLLFAPPDKRIEQLRRAEKLHDMIEPTSLYPYEFLSFRITGYRSESTDRVVLVGQAVQADLRQLIDVLSRSVDIPIDDEPTLTVQALAQRLNVSTKTISRYRQAGLRWRWVTDGSRQRVGIAPQAVSHFLNTHHDQVQRAGQFTQLDPQTRSMLIQRARRIAQGRDVSLFKVASHLARRTGRAVETVRRLLQQHDQANPENPIFVDHRPPLTAREKRLIARAHARGVRVPRLAERFGRTRSTIYRAIREQRLIQLRQQPLDWIDSPLFEHPDADQVILGPSYAPPLPGVEAAGGESTRSAASSITTPAAAGDLPELMGWHQGPAWPPEVRRRVTVRYNYLKYKAARLLEQISATEPRAGDLDEVEAALKEAGQLRQRLMGNALPIVWTTARAHLHGQQHHSLVLLVALIEQGLAVLAQVVDQYDPAREQTLEGYLRWRLFRRFASEPASGDHAAAPPLPPQAHRRITPQQAAEQLRAAAARCGIDPPDLTEAAAFSQPAPQRPALAR